MREVLSGSGPTALTERCLWNHIGFHRRIAWVNVYTTKHGTFYTLHDKKKLAVKEPPLYPRWDLLCRVRIRPNMNFRPDMVWRKKWAKPPVYTERPRKVVVNETDA